MLATVADSKGRQAIDPEVHSQSSSHDGSRTPPEIQYEIMRRHKMGLCLADICRDVHCDPRTAKAVIENWGTSEHRLRLEAHRAQLVDAIIDSWPEASKRGKVDSLMSSAYSLGVADPPKTSAGPNLAVQINLNGGPEPQSLVVAASSLEPSVETGQISPESDNAAYVSLQVVEPEGLAKPSVAQPAAPSKPKRQRKAGGPAR